MELIYFMYLGFGAFWKLITFQSLTSIPQVDTAFSIAVILSLVLIVVMAIKPLWRIIVPALSINVTAISVVCFLMVTRNDTPQYGFNALAGAGYFTSLLQLLIIFILFLLVTTVFGVCLYIKRKSLKP